MNYHIFKNISLEDKHTFSLQASAQFFVPCDLPEHILEFLNNESYAKLPRFILGGGSNVVFTKDFEGVILKPTIQGIEKIQENDDYVWLRVGAGENWDNFVAYAVNHNLGGIENLSYIPGSVGASPIQNIGAYGIEVKESIEKVEGINIQKKELVIFKKHDCNFTYRSSIFKEELFNKIIITHVTFRLTKQHNLVTDYSGVQEELQNYNEINIKTLREAIISIRKRKLPDPQVIPNSGSFFKNPILPKEKVHTLKNTYPLLPIFPYNEREEKISAAWLIEQCGFKGQRAGAIGVSEKHALVLVNYGNGNGNDLRKLVNEIQQSVQKKFSIHLKPEVLIL